MELADQEDWPLHAKCRGMADALFPEGKDQKRARAVCSGCPVRANCLAEALDNRIEWGVWGGMTERERRQLLRQRPDVSSWSDLLLAADAPIEQLLGPDKRNRGKGVVTRGPWREGQVTESTAESQAPKRRTFHVSRPRATSNETKSA